jgi:hypothetical protein
MKNALEITERYIHDIQPLLILSERWTSKKWLEFGTTLINNMKAVAIYIKYESDLLYPFIVCLDALISHCLDKKEDIMYNILKHWAIELKIVHRFLVFRSITNNSDLNN